MSTGDEGFRKHAAMRIRFDVARIEDEAGARDGIIERASAVALVERRAWQRAEFRVFERAADERAQRPGNPPLYGEPRGAIGTTDPIEIGRRGATIAVVDRVVALTVVSEPVRSNEAHRETEPPAVPVRRCLRVEDGGIAPLGARPDVERGAGKIWLGPLSEPQRARPVVMARKPKLVGSRVVDERIEVIDPVTRQTRLSIRLGLCGRSQRCRQGEQQDGQARVNREAVSRSLASVPSWAAKRLG